MILSGGNTVFLGFASDPEDGWVPDSHLTWISSVDGVIGVGSGVNVYGPVGTTAPLTPGAHVIRLRAEDSNGTVSSAFVNVLVEPPNHP